MGNELVNEQHFDIIVKRTSSMNALRFRLV